MVHVTYFDGRTVRRTLRNREVAWMFLDMLAASGIHYEVSFS